MSNKPPFNAFGEKQLGNRRTALIRIGAAWPHEKGNGFTIQLDATPLHFDGRIVVLEADREEQPSEAPENDAREQEAF
jgi:hypothetical protein